MKKALIPLFAFALVSSAFAQYKGKYVGWSTGYVYGGGTLPAGVYKAFTYLVNFHITVDGSGGLSTGDLPQSDQANFVAQCHANKVKALLCIGGEGEHPHFVAACANAGTQTTLVKNIIAMALKYGYDGVDLDWEVAEDPNYDNSPANVAKFVAFHKQVRDSVKAHPPLMITAAITDDWYPNCSAAVCSMMDQANGMSYDIKAANEYQDANIVFKLGAPKANHGIGFDMSNLADNLAKCRLAIDSGFGGVMGWDVSKSSASAYDSIAHYVNHNAATAIGRFSIAPSSREGAALSVKSDPATGLMTIFYSVPPTFSGSIVDLDMHDVGGALVKRIYHGSGNPGAIFIPMHGNAPGKYILDLSANSNLQKSQMVLVK